MLDHSVLQEGPSQEYDDPKFEWSHPGRQWREYLGEERSQFRMAKNTEGEGDRSLLLKGSQTTFLIVQVCPDKAPTHCWVSVFHNLTVWSPLAVACRNEVSGEKGRGLGGKQNKQYQHHRDSRPSQR